MSFISYSIKSYDMNTHQYTFVIIDSELGEIEDTSDKTPGAAFSVMLANVYGKLNCPVGKNLALLIMYQRRRNSTNVLGYTFKELIEWQDINCPAHVPNWQQYAKERDEYLEKLLPLL